MILNAIQQLAFEHVIWPIVSSALIAIFGWIATQWQKYTGQKIDQKHQESYRIGLENAIKQALQKLILSGKMSENDKMVPVALVDETLNDAATYMEKKMPEAVAHLGVSFDGIKESLLARLPLPFDLNSK